MGFGNSSFQQAGITLPTVLYWKTRTRSKKRYNSLILCVFYHMNSLWIRVTWNLSFIYFLCDTIPLMDEHNLNKKCLPGKVLHSPHGAPKESF